VAAPAAAASGPAGAARTGHRWSGAGSARADAHAAAARGDLDEAVAAHERCLAADRIAEMPFEAARARLGLGAVLRRANRRRSAREALQAAATALDEMGSPVWAARARAELAAVSGRAPSAVDELTGMQRRVATLAAAGRTNAEIAAELFLSVRTVEAHLAAVYRKVGARSRTELAYLTMVAE
jgi:DNA-binding CsgD family transcriptional regulator